MKKQQKQEANADGFSSDEEVKHEEIILEIKKQDEPECMHKEEVKFKIPPPEEIKRKSYSLNPDIITGWAPKADLPVPIPIVFDNRRVDSIVKRLLQKKYENIKLCYLGPRFENTFYAWYDKDFDFPYSHVKPPQNMKFTNRQFCGQHWDAEDGLIFDSFFQSGNLDCAIRVGERQYDLYIRVDSNTRGHLQWFNFKISNLQKLQKYRINICNFQKNKSLYSRGQKPFIFSKQKFAKEKISWEQAGDSVKFQQKPGKSVKILNIEFNCLHKLSFDYYTEYSNDEVQMAYCIPYTYCQLKNYLAALQKKHIKKGFLSVTKLCTSLGGLDIPLIIINQNLANLIHSAGDLSTHSQDTRINKKCVIVSGRAHPGQSNGSYMMEGFLNFLCSDTNEAKFLREQFIFKIVPMLNPDGVCLGNYRTGISGKDFNRQYRNPDKMIFPEVYVFKKLVVESKAIFGDNLIMFLDFHGHSIKKNVFVYGPEFPIIQRHYYECRIFPKLLSNHTKMFRYYSCSFKIAQFKETTARAVLLRKLMIPFSYTIEASNGSYYDQDAMRDILFVQKSWIQMGVKIGAALAEYGDLIISSQRSRNEKLEQKKMKKQLKIRKSSKSKQNYMNNAQQSSAKALSYNDDRILKLFEEIKKAEENKQKQKNEEDNFSEGSSDGQNEKDDLSHQKISLLYQIIKNKKMSISEKQKKCFLEADSKHQMTKQFEEQPQSMAAKVEDEKQLVINDEIFIPNNNLRGHFLKNKLNNTAYLPDRKKEKVAAKIINFSFIGHSRPIYQSVEQRRNSLKNECKDTIDLKKQKSGNSSKNNKVLDLSDNTYRQTFGTPKQRNEKGFDIKNLTFTNMSPRKMGAKLEEYKYRRLFIDEYKV